MRDRVLDGLDLSGSEQVLDLGCGSGLMLLGAADRLTTGPATGIDVWGRATRPARTGRSAWTTQNGWESATGSSSSMGT